VKPARRRAALFVACLALAPALHGATDMKLAFPGALGEAATTPGGRGGEIVRVTTLAASGPGSLRAAIERSGPRTIVFEVGGVIDLDKATLVVAEPFVTIAGQTAPSPGITLIRGGVVVKTHDVVVRHIRIRPGTAGVARMGGVDFDALTTQSGARDVIVDHCSMTWATDENLSASGPRFEGDTPDEWRRRMSNRITFSSNLLAEGLAHASHAKGEHSKGTLIHDNASEILIVGNLYAHNWERNPLFKGGARGFVINNLIYDPGPRAVHYNLIAEEWVGREYQAGRVVAIGNVLRAGPSTPDDVAFFMFGGSGDVELHLADNLAVDRLGNPLPQRGSYTTSRARVIELAAAPALPLGVKPLDARDVQDAVIRDAGARPWNRDEIDRRIVANVIEGRGDIIDHEDEVGGYPKHAETRQAFDPAAWDLDTMTPHVAPTPDPPPR
jgi:pectate lyase